MLEPLEKHTQCPISFHILFFSSQLPLHDRPTDAGTCWERINHINMRALIPSSFLASFTLGVSSNLPTIAICGQEQESALELTRRAAPCPVSSQGMVI